MVLTTFYFQLHQPSRLNPDLNDKDNFTWSSKDREVYQKVAQKCYITATKMFNEIIKDNPDFRICFSFSGTLIDQSKSYGEKKYDIIPLLQELYESGKDKKNNKEIRRVEFLDETYYHCCRLESVGKTRIA